MDMTTYEIESFSRKKRDYITQFNAIASEVTDIKQLFSVILKSHELFLNLVQVQNPNFILKCWF